MTVVRGSRARLGEQDAATTSELVSHERAAAELSSDTFLVDIRRSDGDGVQDESLGVALEARFGQLVARMSTLELPWSG